MKIKIKIEMKIVHLKQRFSFQLTIDTSVLWNVVVEEWTSWSVFEDVLEVVNQIFFSFWFVEEVRQQDNCVDINFFSMFGQFIYISDGCTPDGENHM